MPLNIFAPEIGTQGQEYAHTQPNEGLETAGKASGLKAEGAALSNQALEKAGNDIEQGLTTLAHNYVVQQKMGLVDQLNNLQKGLYIEQNGGFNNKMLSDPNIKSAFNELQSVKALRDQGYANQDAVALRAEAIVKKYQNAAPMFSNEFHIMARDMLGHDPMGTQYNILVNNGPGAAPDANTPEAKYAQQVHDLALKLNTSDKDAAKLLQQKTANEIESADVGLKLKMGQLNVQQNKQLATQVTGDLDRKISANLMIPSDPKNPASSLMGTVLALEKANGGKGLTPEQSQQLISKMDQLKIALKAQYSADPNNQGLDTATKGEIDRHIDGRMKDFEDLIKNGDMTKIYENGLKNLTASQQYKLLQNPLFLKLVAEQKLGILSAISQIKSIEQISDADFSGLNIGSKDQATNAALQARDDIAKYNVVKGQNALDMTMRADTAKYILNDPASNADQKQAAFNTLKANGGTAMTLQFFNTVEGKQALNSDPSVRQNYQHLVTSEMTSMVGTVAPLIQQISAAGRSVNIDKDGNVSIGGSLFGNTSDANKTLLQNANVADKIDELQSLQGSIKQLIQSIKNNGPALNLPDSNKTISEFIKELSSPKEQKSMESNEEAGQSTNPKGLNSTLPLGLRFNNPGNIMQSDGKPVSYDTPHQGLSAMSSLLQTYANRGQNTIASIIGGINGEHAYSATDQGSYIAYVAHRLGVSSTQQLDMQDKETRGAVMRAMVEFEQGKDSTGKYYADQFSKDDYTGGEISYSQLDHENKTISDRAAFNLPPRNIDGGTPIPQQIYDSPIYTKAETEIEKYKEQGLTNSPIVTIVDFSKPSTEKRLWVINTSTNKVLLNTWVTHGSGSGGKMATQFSNQDGSHESSVGTFITDKTYSGAHGYSLRIRGLDKGINDNVYKRNIVIHGANYIGNGKTGRSFGCFAVPEEDAGKFINLVKDGTIIYAQGNQSQDSVTENEQLAQN